MIDSIIAQIVQQMSNKMKVFRWILPVFPIFYNLFTICRRPRTDRAECVRRVLTAGAAADIIKAEPFPFMFSREPEF